MENTDNTKTLNWLAETVDDISQQIGVRLAEEASPAFGGVGQLEVQHGMGRFGMWDLSPNTNAGAWTLSVASRNMPQAKALGQNNKYAINLPGTARMANNNYEILISKIGEREQDTLLGMVPERLHDPLRRAWAEGREALTATEEADLKNVMLMRTLVYNSVHEAAGHSVRGSGHTALGKGYTEGGGGVSGTPGNVREKFDDLHNIAVRHLQDPKISGDIETIIADPRHMRAGGRIDKLREAIYPNEYVKVMQEAKAKARAARIAKINGPTKSTEPVIEYVDDMAGGAGARGAEIEAEDFVGPQIEEALQARIKRGLTSQRLGARKADADRIKIRELQAKSLAALEQELSSGKITVDQFREMQDQVMSTSVVKDPNKAVAMTQKELDDAWRTINQTGPDDRFTRMRLRKSVEKMHRGEQLAKSEIDDVRDFFLAGRVSDEMDFLEKMWRGLRDTVGLSRAIMTSWDLSAAGRQGLYASVMNPKIAAEAMMDQMKAFVGTEDQFKLFMHKLESPRYNPYLDLQKESGLHFSHQYEPGKENLAEEMFQYSKFADKVPMVRRSERAYIAYLNKMRVELFNKMTDKMLLPKEDGGLGLTIDDNMQEFKDLAYMVNTLTGRGELSAGHISPASFMGKKLNLRESFTPGKETLERAHQLLTTGLFAPRFMASRGAMLRDATTAFAGGNLSPVIYKEYMRNAMGTTMTIATVMSALAAMGIGKLDWDPKSSDFGVLKIGNTRYDPWGGMKQWVKLHTMLASDEYITSTKRRRKFGEFGGRDKTDVLTQFMLTKSSPATSLILEAVTGKNVIGKERSLPVAALERVTPMILQNMYEIYEEEGAAQTALSLPFITVGGSTASYNPFRRQ
jgi:hypothetical protein